MTNLNTCQLQLLTAAHQSADGVVDAPTESKPSTRGLIKRGMIIALPMENGPDRLLITEAGRAAVAPQEPSRALADLVESSVGRDSDAPTPADEVPTIPEQTGKIGALIGLLRRPEGATVAAMMDATGWQAHSVRGAMSGAIKKKLGIEVISEKTQAGRVYRIPAEAGE